MDLVSAKNVIKLPIMVEAKHLRKAHFLLEFKEMLSVVQLVLLRGPELGR